MSGLLILAVLAVALVAGTAAFVVSIRRPSDPLAGLSPEQRVARIERQHALQAKAREVLAIAEAQIFARALGIDADTLADVETFPGDDLAVPNSVHVKFTALSPTWASRKHDHATVVWVCWYTDSNHTFIVAPDMTRSALVKAYVERVKAATV